MVAAVAVSGERFFYFCTEGCRWSFAAMCLRDGISGVVVSPSSLLLLIDGYNVLAPVAPPARGVDTAWLQRERTQLIDRLVRGLDREVRVRACVVFDAADPPRDRPSEFVVEGLEIVFAVDYPEADDLLELLIMECSAPRTLAVVSSDNRVRLAAKRRGCTVYDSQPWFDDLLDGVVGLAGGRRLKSGQGRGPTEAEDAADPMDQDEVAGWLREFGF